MQRGPGYGERGPGVPEILGWAIAGAFWLGIEGLGLGALWGVALGGGAFPLAMWVAIGMAVLGALLGPAAGVQRGGAFGMGAIFGGLGIIAAIAGLIVWLVG